MGNAIIARNIAAVPTASSVFMPPSSGINIAQNATDFIYRGKALMPVIQALDVTRRTRVVVRQNFAISLAYNALAVPAAVLGLVTPLIAAIAMSSSSLIVVANALQLNLGRQPR